MENNRSSVSPPMIILGPRQAPAAPAQQQPSQLVSFQQLYQPASQHPYQQVPQQTTTVPQQIPQQPYQQAPRQLYQQAIQQPYQQKQPQPVYQPQQISLQTYQQQMPSQIYQQQLPQRTFSGQVSQQQQQQQIPQQAYRQLPQQSHQPLPQLQVQQFGQQQQQQQKQQPLLIQCYRFDDFDGDLSSLVVANGNNRPSSVAVNSTGNSANNANSQKRPRQSRDDDYVQDYEEEDSNDDDDDDDSADEDSNSDDESEPELDAPISQLLTSHRQGSRPAPSLAVQSAYALFFKDTLPQVKRDQPAMAFGEASQAIERMWQRLGQAGKAAYAKRSSALRSNKPYSLPVPVNLGHRPQQQQPKAKPAKVQPKTQRKPKQHQQSAEGKKAKRLKKEKQEMQKNLTIKKPKKVITEEAGFCARHGCSKPAVDHPQWDGEYCSADCCLLHVGQVRLLFAGMSAAGHTLSAS